MNDTLDSSKEPDFAALFNMFHKAKERLFYPSITFPVPGDLPGVEPIIVKLYLAKKGYIAIMLEDAYSGKITPANATYPAIFRMYIPSMNVKREIWKFCKDPLAGVKMKGQRYNSCCFCRQQLTNAASLFAGYGPTCADNFGLPWGETGV